MRQILACMGAMALLTTLAMADSVVVSGGDRFEGVVLADTPKAITICTAESVLQIPRGEATEIAKDKGTPPATAVGQLPSWRGVMKGLATSKWATEVEQIPATVIDEGVLKSVPYRSFRFRRDYEVNIYGDPEAPACVEIGIYRDLRKGLLSQLNCREFAKLLVTSDVDRKLLDALDASGDSVEHRGLTIEITPPESPDAYGGWWISIYRQDLLDKSRASKEEMAGISAPMQVETNQAMKPARAGGDPQPVAAKPQPAVSPGNAAGPSRDPAAWTPPASWTSQELSQARSSSSGRVYVRGYTRKDGTYVQPHTRRR